MMFFLIGHDRAFVPEGHLTVARRFNAGTGRKCRESRRDGWKQAHCLRDWQVLKTQPSLRDSNRFCLIPALKRRAIISLSLRDDTAEQKIKCFAVAD